MSKICDLTGKTALTGITREVCAKALKTIDKKGIYQVLLDVEKKGFIK